MKRSGRQKKKSTGIYIGAGIVVLLAAAGGGFFYYQHVQEQQVVKAGEQTIEGFIDSLNQENYEEAVKSLQVEKDSDLTEQDILEKYQNIYGAAEIRGIKLSDLSVTKKRMIRMSLRIRLK